MFFDIAENQQFFATSGFSNPFRPILFKMPSALRTLLDRFLQENNAVPHSFNNEEALPFLAKLKTVVSDRELAAPEVFGDESFPDANIVAEYLDGQLDDAQLLQDYEEICLRSDMILAEVGCCHDILNRDLRETLVPSRQCRRRLYFIPQEDSVPDGEQEFSRGDARYPADGFRETAYSGENTSGKTRFSGDGTRNCVETRPTDNSRCTQSVRVESGRYVVDGKTNEVLFDRNDIPFDAIRNSGSERRSAGESDVSFVSGNYRRGCDPSDVIDRNDGYQMEETGSRSTCQGNGSQSTVSDIDFRDNAKAAKRNRSQKNTEKRVDLKSLKKKDHYFVRFCLTMGFCFFVFRYGLPFYRDYRESQVRQTWSVESANSPEQKSKTLSQPESQARYFSSKNFTAQEITPEEAIQLSQMASKKEEPEKQIDLATGNDRQDANSTDRLFDDSETETSSQITRFVSSTPPQKTRSGLEEFNTTDENGRRVFVVVPTWNNDIFHR